MDAFELADLVRRRNQSDSSYLEFLSVSSLSVGLYALSAGAVDQQQPHTEGEVYYVISGRGFIQVGAESRAVEAGTIVFVRYRVPENGTGLCLCSPSSLYPRGEYSFSFIARHITEALDTSPPGLWLHRGN